mmetsp:Transcript_41300/g.119497  ORF Transcript_41300/g.119497 Transcript_41300/m.119497 type:complete len:392 (+) Transcript_41300:914-2089(+)
MGFSRRLCGHRASHEAPMSTKTPNFMTLVTRPSSTGSPTLKSAGHGRVETESRMFTGSASVIFRPVTFSPTLKSLKGLGSWLVGQRASRLAPTLRKTPNAMARVTVPSTSMPTVRPPRGGSCSSSEAALAAAAMVSGRETSRSSALGSTLMMTSSSSFSPSLYSPIGFASAFNRISASFVAPMSTKTPMVSSARCTVPETVAPRTSFESGVPTSSSDFVVTVMRVPSTLNTIRSATSPLEYSSFGLLSSLVGASTSLERPASKKMPVSLTVSTVPSSRSPSATSMAMRRGETSTWPFSLFTEETLRPGMVSPFLYSLTGFSSCCVLQRASLLAPMSTQRPKFLLMFTTVPSTLSPTFKREMSKDDFIASEPPSNLVVTVTFSPSILSIRSL